jgi:hypothetical protein
MVVREVKYRNSLAHASNAKLKGMVYARYGVCPTNTKDAGQVQEVQEV